MRDHTEIETDWDNEDDPVYFVPSFMTRLYRAFVELEHSVGEPAMMEVIGAWMNVLQVQFVPGLWGEAVSALKHRIFGEGEGEVKFRPISIEGSLTRIDEIILFLTLFRCDRMRADGDQALDWKPSGDVMDFLNLASGSFGFFSFHRG